MNVALRLTSCLLVFPLFVCAEPEEGEIITAQEIAGQRYNYSRGETKTADQHQLEITYRIKGDTITRTSVYDAVKKERVPGEIVYKIEGREPAVDREPVIRAVGKSSTGSTEILVIGKTFIHSIRSTPDELVISRLKRTDMEELPEIAAADWNAGAEDPIPVPEDVPALPAPTKTTPLQRSPAEQKAWDAGYASGVSVSKTGAFATPFPTHGPSDEKQAWFQGFKVGLNVEAKRENQNSTAIPPEAGE